MYDDFPKTPETLKHRLSNINDTTQTWGHLPETAGGHLDHTDRANCEQLTQKTARWEQAQIRMDDLESASQKKWSKQTGQIIELILIFIGAFAVSKAAQLVASIVIQGAIAIFIGLMIGAFWVWLTHHCATKGIAEFRCKHSSRNAVKTIDKLEREDPHQNFLTTIRYHTRKQLIQTVEAPTLEKIFWADLLMAIAASVIEILVAFWIASPSGLLLAIILSFFPVALIWGYSFVKSEHVNFAIFARDKMLVYETYLPSAEVTDQELLHVVKVDSHFHYFTAVTPHGLTTVQGAEAKAISHLAAEQVQDWYQAYSHALEDRKTQYRQALSSVEENTPFQGQPQPGQTPAQVHGNAAQQRQSMIAAKRQALEEDYQEDLEDLKEKYGYVIRRWNAIRERAEQEFVRWEGQYA